MAADDLTERDVSLLQAAVLEWGPSHFVEYPWRCTTVPLWQGLLAEFLLLRTHRQQVVPAFRLLQHRFPTARSLGEASDDQLLEIVEPLGLRWRAPLFLRLARQLSAWDGAVPLSLGELRALPGVGDYIAAATLALHAGQHAALIDSNIVRLLARLVGRPFNGETRRKRWLRELAERITPRERARDFGYGLLDLSMLVCQPRNPRCGDCPLAGICHFATPDRSITEARGSS